MGRRKKEEKIGFRPAAMALPLNLFLLLKSLNFFDFGRKAP